MPDYQISGVLEEEKKGNLERKTAEILFWASAVEERAFLQRSQAV